jgi:hypothetical protein
MDYINLIKARSDNELTYDEWCRIRRTGTPEEIEEAVEKMNAQGGYDCLVHSF